MLLVTEAASEATHVRKAGPGASDRQRAVARLRNRFSAVAGELGSYLRRLPDGETGERGRCIFFQAMMLRAHPAMEEDSTEPPFRFVQWDGKVIRETMRLRFKPGIGPNGITFDRL